MPFRHKVRTQEPAQTPFLSSIGLTPANIGSLLGSLGNGLFSWLGGSGAKKQYKADRSNLEGTIGTDMIDVNQISGLLQKAIWNSSGEVAPGMQAMYGENYQGALAESRISQLTSLLADMHSQHQFKKSARDYDARKTLLGLSAQDYMG